MRRNLFLIIIIFSLINLSAVYPIHKETQNKDKKKEEALIMRHESKFNNFVGSNLFDGIRKECFSLEDVNLLVARKEFEIMIPKELPPDLLDDKDVRQILRYFYSGFYMFRRLEDCRSRRVMEKAFYDTLGGFLRYYLIPVSKFSYYASKVELRTVRNVLTLYQKSRVFLNTNGNGWRLPMRDPITELKSVKTYPIKIANHNSFDNEKCCSDLDLTTAPKNNAEGFDDMIISLPKIEQPDSEGYLSNIWLPFSQKRTYNLRSGRSAFILVKFYRSVSRCYIKKSLPQKCFNRKFRKWIVENLKVHLGDDQFYPGLGGILNIYENTIQGETDDKKNLSSKIDDENATCLKRRNANIGIFDEEVLRTGTQKDHNLLHTEASKDYAYKKLSNSILTNNNLDDALKMLNREYKKECTCPTTMCPTTKCTQRTTCFPVQKTTKPNKCIESSETTTIQPKTKLSTSTTTKTTNVSTTTVATTADQNTKNSTTQSTDTATVFPTTEQSTRKKGPTTAKTRTTTSKTKPFTKPTKQSTTKRPATVPTRKMDLLLLFIAGGVFFTMFKKIKKNFEKDKKVVLPLPSSQESTTSKEKAGKDAKKDAKKDTKKDKKSKDAKKDTKKETKKSKDAKKEQKGTKKSKDAKKDAKKEQKEEAKKSKDARKLEAKKAKEAKKDRKKTTKGVRNSKKSEKSADSTDSTGSARRAERRAQRRTRQRRHHSQKRWIDL